MSFLDPRHLVRCAARLAAALAIAYAAAMPVSAASVAELHPVTARLVPELAAIAPGTTLWVDLHLDIAPGWHTYWRNPGDSGLPTEIAWTLPAGFAAGEIVWPVPERFVVEGLGNYGYRDAVDLLVPITVSQDVKPDGTGRLDAAASWLVCSDICIPGDAKLSVALPVAATPAVDPSVQELFAAARNHLPKPASFEARFATTAHELRLIVPEEAFSGSEQPKAAFFPFDANVVDAAAEPKLQHRGNGFELTLARANTPAATIPKTLDGILVL
ncbi:MAG TPA: protein-disulfide reductase DsbD domain-containing protein, partial [Stellaceae bacterium]